MLFIIMLFSNRAIFWNNPLSTDFHDTICAYWSSFKVEFWKPVLSRRMMTQMLKYTPYYQRADRLSANVLVFRYLFNLFYWPAGSTATQRGSSCISICIEDRGNFCGDHTVYHCVCLLAWRSASASAPRFTYSWDVNEFVLFSAAVVSWVWVGVSSTTPPRMINEYLRCFRTLGTHIPKYKHQQNIWNMYRYNMYVNSGEARIGKELSGNWFDINFFL